MGFVSQADHHGGEHVLGWTCVWTKNKTLIYIAGSGSASAEVIVDFSPCPIETVKVHVQTQPGFVRGLSDG
ncbi:Mitochondrial phosphate carrier protein 2 [Ranunculus cassubicifolius]